MNNLEKVVEDWITSIYNSAMEKPLRILSIFNDFFGEARVDMQDYHSIEELKIIITTSKVRNYISISSELYKNSLTVDDNYDKSILELPESIVNSIIEDPAIKSYIISSYFNDITILVHFPQVRVTNEHDRYVDINNLWAKIKIDYEGKLNGRFGLNRSEYTLLHLQSNYMHSHVSSIPTNDFSYFQSPCTGSGPINGTIASLNRDFDEDLWNLFCLELKKYVSVESIAGTPYHYLERLGTSTMITGENNFYVCLGYSHAISRVLSTDFIKEFVTYFINNKKLKFNYANGSYSIGMSFVEYIILISNEFISWYNKMYREGKAKSTYNTLISKGVIKECIIDNNKIYYDRNRENLITYSRYVGKKVCTFKGNDITISISDITSTNNENKSIILNTDLSLYILNKIVKVLNYRYGRSKTTGEIDDTGAKVRYL